MGKLVIVWLKGTEVLGTSPWTRGLEAAKQHAMESFPIYQKQNGATSVEVRDDLNIDPLFRFSKKDDE